MKHRYERLPAEASGVGLFAYSLILRRDLELLELAVR
jgi:hypothetical protein